MAELDVRTAQEQARKMHAYVDSFNGQTFSPALDSVDRQNLAVALDNLLETAAMLGNVSDRLSCASGKAEPAIWANFPCYLIDHCEGDTINEEGLQRALSDMLADPKYATPTAATPAAPGEVTDAQILAVFDMRDGIMESLDQMALRFARRVLALSNPAPVAAPASVPQAIDQLVSALAESKGWLRDYARSEPVYKLDRDMLDTLGSRRIAGTLIQNGRVVIKLDK